MTFPINSTTVPESVSNQSFSGHAIIYLLFRLTNEWMISDFFQLFLFDSVRPINNLSVKQGQVFLGWTSTKLG